MNMYKYRAAKVAALVGATVVALAGCSASATEAPAPGNSGDSATITLNVGRFPKGAGAAFVTQKMINENMVEAAGKDLGINLKVNWTDMANAVAVGQALTGGQLDVGPMGSSAYVGLAVKSQPITPLTVAEGRFKFVLITKQGSPIRNLADLQGKTVGTLPGTDLYNVLAEMLLAQFGSADPAAAGVTIVNGGSVPQLARVPKGTDASIVTIPSYLDAHAQDPSIVAVLNSYGTSEEYYSGPEGAGAGLTIGTASKSPFWPEGFYGHRAVFVARDAYVQEQPKAVEAFVLAQQRALRSIQSDGPQAAAALVSKDWGLDPATGAPIVADDLVVRRGWSYLTRGDAAVLLMQSELALQSKATAAAITWDELKTALSKGADVLRAAYEADAQQPPASAFTDTSQDSRGLPVWQANEWTAK